MNFREIIKPYNNCLLATNKANQDRPRTINPLIRLQYKIKIKKRNGGNSKKAKFSDLIGSSKVHRWLGLTIYIAGLWMDFIHSWFVFTILPIGRIRRYGSAWILLET